MNLGSLKLEITLAALKEIAKGEGRFSRDPHEHACNCIEDMTALATAAIELAETMQAANAAEETK